MTLPLNLHQYIYFSFKSCPSLNGEKNVNLKIIIVEVFCLRICRDILHRLFTYFTFYNCIVSLTINHAFVIMSYDLIYLIFSSIVKFFSLHTSHISYLNMRTRCLCQHLNFTIHAHKTIIIVHGFLLPLLLLS